MVNRLYSFDSSAFINGRRDLLPPDIFRSFWTNVEEMIDTGTVQAVDVVRDEVRRRDDEVTAWAGAHPDLFVALEADVQLATRDVLALHPKLMGIGGGRNAADPFVIGLARARSGVVVTEEIPSGTLVRPRIPDVCEAIDVPCINLVRFAREQGWSW